MVLWSNVPADPSIVGKKARTDNDDRVINQ